MKKRKTKYMHISWDYGILDFAGTPHKKKTVCNKRVTMDQIQDDAPTCPECIRINLEIAQAAQEAINAQHTPDPELERLVREYVKKAMEEQNGRTD